MAFSGYQSATMNSPIQTSSGGMLVVPDLSGLTTPIITLEWTFLNPSAPYPFSNTIFVPITNVTNGTLTIVLPDATYASFPQTIIVFNQSANQTIVFYDSATNYVCTIFPQGTANSSNNGIILLTNNGVNITETSYWQFIPVSGTPYPTPASTYAGFGLVVDTYYQNSASNNQGPVFNPATQYVTGVIPNPTAHVSSVNLVLSPYVYNFSAQQITFQFTFNNVTAATVILQGISGNAVTSETKILTGSTSSWLTSNSYTAILSFEVTQLQPTSASSPPTMTVKATNLNNITGAPYPLDSSQPVFTLDDATTALVYNNRSQIILAPSGQGNTTFSATLPALTGGISAALANGYSLGFVNQSSQNFTITLPTTGAVTINQKASYVLPPGGATYVVYNQPDTDWVVLSSILPLSTASGGLGESLTNLQAGQMLISDNPGGTYSAFKAFQLNNNQLFYWNGSSLQWVTPPTTGGPYYLTYTPNNTPPFVWSLT